MSLIALSNGIPSDTCKPKPTSIKTISEADIGMAFDGDFDRCFL